MWIGLLYSILCLTCFEDLRYDHSVSNNLSQKIAFYREKVVQCLLLGEYVKPKAYTIETMLYYFACEYFGSSDSQFSLSLIFGMIVRLAMRSGFHRSPIHFPNLSVFQAEMRRRVWAVILQGDILVAAHHGLPRMINDSQIDTELPGNFLDDDFDQASSVLPPPRSDASTPVAYTISKVQLLTVYGSIIDRTNSVEPLSYGEVMDLDSKLQEVEKSLPKASNENDCSISTREIFLDLALLRAKCLLHRRFLVMAHFESKYNYSRRCCIEAAMRILALHKEVSRDRPENLFHGRVQLKFSSVHSNDYLLGAMILCLELHNQMAHSEPGLSSETNSTQVEMLRALEDSYEAWYRSSDDSAEALSASRALAVMLSKVRGGNSVSRFAINEDSFSKSSNNEALQQPLPTPTSDFPDSASNISMAKMSTNSMSALEGMIESSTNLDWVRK